MKKLFLLLTCVSINTYASEMQKPISLSQAIESLIEHNMPTADVGISVKDATSGKTIYERQSYQLFTPASNTKLFSSAAALYHLGENFTFDTSVYANTKKLKSKTLNGNLYIKFSGDPSFRAIHLKKLIANTHKKINTIKGNVVIDDSQFSGEVYGPGWSQEDLNWYFCAPITSVMINQNTVDVNIIPGSKLGNHAQLKVVDKDFMPYVKVSSDKIKTVTYPTAEKHCSLYPKGNSKNNYHVSGCWPISNKARTLHFAIRNPNLLAKQIILSELIKNNIKLNGKIVFGTTPTSLKTISTHQSRPLKLLLQTVLKDSNNVYAEAITKTLGKYVYNVGSFQEGVNAIENILYDKANLDFNKIVLRDGSGGSRYTLISPRQITRLLFVIHHTPKIAKLFEQALPESGEDGTLKHRMKSFDLKGKLFAKTGSMTGVSTLSGFLTTRNNQKLIFSIMVNHIVGDINEARELQAQIASVLYGGVRATR